MGELHEICPMSTGVFSFPIKLLGKGVFAGKRTAEGELPVEEEL